MGDIFGVRNRNNKFYMALKTSTVPFIVPLIGIQNFQNEYVWVILYLSPKFM